MGGKILRRIKKDLEKRIKHTKKIIFFLDYDGTLTPIRKKPRLAKIDKNTKLLLTKLASKPHSRVFIVSGRSLKDIRSLIGLRSLCYIGNHGIELEGPGFKYINPKAKSLKPFIQRAYQTLKKKLKIKGIILENKIYTLSLHYRLVDSKKMPVLKKIFNGIIRDLQKTKKVKITEGKKVLEIRPNTKWDKGKILKWVLKKKKSKGATVISIGDDKTDEDAFRALGKKGISILVSGKQRKTFAQYRLNSPKEVRNFLYELVD